MSELLSQTVYFYLAFFILQAQRLQLQHNAFELILALYVFLLNLADGNFAPCSIFNNIIRLLQLIEKLNFPKLSNLLLIFINQIEPLFFVLVEPALILLLVFSKSLLYLPFLI